MRALIVAATVLAGAHAACAEVVGKVGVDWTGNEVLVEAFDDPKVSGVTCHLSYFSRSMVDRVFQGNWFEDPSNSAIECSQTGPIVLGDIARGRAGEDVFSEGRSLIFKTLKVKRIYDEDNQVLVYLSHGAELSGGSAKMAISTVPLALPGEAVSLPAQP